MGVVATKSNTLRRLAAVSPRKEETTLSVRTTAKGLPSSLAMTSAVSVLPQPGGPQSRIRSLGRRAVGLQDLFTVVLAKNFVDQRQVAGRQHDVFDTTSGLAQG